MAKKSDKLTSQWNVKITPFVRKVLWIVGGGILLLLVWYWMDGQIQSQRLKTAKNTYQTLLKAKDSKQQQLRQLKKDDRETVTLRSQWKKMVDQLPAHSKIDQVLKEITKIGMDEKLRFTFFRPQEEKKQEFYRVQPIQIGVTGDYHPLANFISKIANLKSLVVVEDFTLNREKPEQEALSMQLRASVYHDFVEDVQQGHSG
ncbi:MAG: hypothetical protein A3F17_09075 [Gammaproteobacteria bacterium RIFCSPHIGHO2_12_FULL_41_15]|nr:MAG: hypothetical protein A3F17_09075 [Gammaproteobacteria bacterium RIFCSPHIGHO2_12_FULL_41_15]